ncbi:hypothetical protein PTKIN_Ptkin08bG0166900 [Pterospermum kingtungense]
MGRRRQIAIPPPTPTFSLLVVITLYLTLLFPDAPAAKGHDAPKCLPFRRRPWCRNRPESPPPPEPELTPPPPIPELSPPPPIPKPPPPPRRRPFPPPCVPYHRRCPDEPCPPPVHFCRDEPCPPYRRCPPLLSNRGHQYASPPKDK